MALADTFSGKQFSLFVAEDGSASSLLAGVFNDTASEYFRLDIEGVTFPTFNPTQEFEIRSGSAQLASFDDMFVSSTRVINEFTISGRLDVNAKKILLQNALSTASSSVASTDSGDADGNNTSILINNDYQATNIALGTTAAAADSFHQTLSFYFAAPTADDGYKIPGCVCSSLTISADVNDAAGRFNYEATFQSASTPVKGAFAGLTAGATSISASKVFLTELQKQSMSIFDIDSSGTDVSNITPVFNNFSITINNPRQFLGMQTVGGVIVPQVISSAKPELEIMFSGGIKYDGDTDNLIEAHRDSAGTSFLIFAISDVAYFDGTDHQTNFAAGHVLADDSTAKFGFTAHKAKLMSASVTSDDVALVNFEAKVTGTTNTGGHDTDLCAEFLIDS